MSSNTLWREIKQTFLRSDRMVHQLIIINVTIFLLINLTRLLFFLGNSPLNYDFFVPYLAVPSDLKTLAFRPWTLITSLFTHVDFSHILFNMLFLYWFGKILAEFLGNKRILPIYLMGGLSGTFLFILAYQTLPVFRGLAAESVAWGASAAVLAILVAAATLRPDYPVFLLFFGAVRIKWIALVAVLIYLISIPIGNPGGNIAHLGGALFGFIYIKQLQNGRDLTSGINWLFDKAANLFRSKPSLRVTYRTGEKHSRASSHKPSAVTSKQERLDAILDKIAQSGYDSLSKEDKEFLFNVSKEES